MALNIVGSATHSREGAASELVSNALAPSIAPVAGNDDEEQIALNLIFRVKMRGGVLSTAKIVGMRMESVAYQS